MSLSFFKKSKSKSKFNSISPNIILGFLDKNKSYLPHTNKTNEIIEDIERVKLILLHTKSKLKLYQTKTKEQNIPSISYKNLFTILKESTKNRYKIRNSPPFPANLLCYSIMYGNDGEKYESIKNKSGICSWKKIN